MRPSLWFGLLAWASLPASGSPGEMLCLSPGIQPPDIIRRVQPDYSRDARIAQVQGIVVFELTVNERGLPENIKLLSPIGFGLDEKAQNALEQWRFRPTRSNGAIVRSAILVEVRFRLPNAYYDSAAERRRTAFNVAVSRAKGQDLSLVPPAVATLRDLAGKGHAPAMHFIAKLDEILGRSNPEQTFRMVKAAADADYGPALYEMATYHLKGVHVPVDPERAMHLIHEAAVLGSGAAQLDLGRRYASGDGVSKDLARARRYYRLCAAKGNARCQYRLARLLLDDQNGPERERLQAVAWCQLAAEQIPEAGETAAAEVARLNAQQVEWVARLRTQLAAHP